MEVTPAEFARMAGVSRPSLSGKIKRKTLIVNSAGRMDTENPVNASYLAKHRQKQSETRETEADKTGPPPGAQGKVSSRKLLAFPGAGLDDLRISELAGLPIDLINMTVRELIKNYPGLDKIERYVKLYKEWITSQEKEQRVHERNLTLIPKDFVISRLFNFIDTLAKQLLEYPERDAEKIISLVQTLGEAARNDIVKAIKEGLGLVIYGAKEQVISELNTLRNKYQDENKSLDRIEELKEAIEEARNE